MVGAIAMLIGILVGYFLGAKKPDKNTLFEAVQKFKPKEPEWGEPFTVSTDEVAVEKEQRQEEEKGKGERIDVKEFTHVG